MEVILPEGSNGGRDGMLASGFSPSPIALRSCDALTEVDDKQVEEQCEHFSLRGYVAQVRERDPKLCSLFQKFHDQQQNGEHSDRLSPLPVKKFRRWDCRSCVDKVNISDNTAADRTIAAKLESKNHCCSISFIQSGMPLNADCKILFPSPKQLSEEKNVERLNYLGSTTKESNCKLSSDREGTAEANVGSAGQELQVSLSNHGAAVNLSNNVSVDVMAVSETYQKTDKDKGNNTQNPGNPKPSEVILMPNADENEDTEEIVTVDSNTKLVSRPISAQESDQVTEKFEHGEDSSKRNSEDIFEVKHDKSICPADGSDVKFRPKKLKKVRLLSEIINTDAVDTSRNDLEFDYGKYADLREDNSSRMRLTLEQKVGIHISRHTAAEVKSKTTKSKKKYKALDVVDDGSSVINWLKRAHKKLKTEKKDLQHKDLCAPSNSKSALDTSASKYMDLNAKQLNTGKCKQQSTVSGIHRIAPYVHHLPPAGSLNKRKVLGIADISHDNDRIRKKDLKRNVRRMGNLFKTGSEKAAHKYLSKVSPNKCDFQNVSGLHEHRLPKKKKKKKKRFDVMQQREALDDVPMDIVELLARNQQERLLRNDEDALDITHARSKVTVNRKNDCALVATEDPRNKVSTGHETNFFKKKSLMLKKRKFLLDNGGRSVQTTTLHPRKLQNPDHLQDTGEEHAHLHKEDPVIIASCSQTLPSHKDQHIAGARAQSWSHMGMKKSDSFKTTTRDPSIVPCSFQFRPSSQCSDSTFSNMRPVSSNFLTQKPEMTASHAGTKRATNQGQARSFPVALYTMEAENVCDPRTAGPSSGLYTNETMPAMHLLRLMDSSKLMGFPLYGTANGNQMELLQVCNLYSEQTQYNGLTGNSYGAESTLHDTVRPTVEGFEQHHRHEQSSNQPLRPLPRVGVLGSLLQKEIASWSVNCGTQSGYRIGESKGLTSFQMTREEIFDASNPAMFPAKWNNTLQFGSVSSVAEPKDSSAREGVAQCWSKGKGRIDFSQDICVTNRNPADFTTIGDDNEYMIRI